jgi:sulfate adenylyltransferase subunit 1 (EFTu-like GTPase family)
VLTFTRKTEIRGFKEQSVSNKTIQLPMEVKFFVLTVDKVLIWNCSWNQQRLQGIVDFYRHFLEYMEAETKDCTVYTLQ